MIDLQLRQTRKFDELEERYKKQLFRPTDASINIEFFAGNGSLMNTPNYFRVVNEHCFSNVTKDQAMINHRIKLVVDQKKVPTLVMENKNNIVPDSANSRKIAISPLPQRTTCQRKVSTTC